MQTHHTHAHGNSGTHIPILDTMQKPQILDRQHRLHHIEHRNRHPLQGFPTKLKKPHYSNKT